MWRINGRPASGGGISDADSGASGAAGANLELPPTGTYGTAPDALSLAVPGVVAGHAAEQAREYWRAEIASLGGVSPLLHFVDAARTHIELTNAHPSGLPAFIAGEATLLSNLIREDVALKAARNAASAITDKGIELRSVRGLDAVKLAIGLAEWRHDGDEFLAPVLLRPVSIRRYGRDFELRLRGRAELNPELARALSQQFNIDLNPDDFAALAHESGAFKPQPVIDRLRQITQHLPWFSVRPRLLVSSFADVSAAMLEDAGDFDVPVLDALGGHRGARLAVESAFAPASVVGQDVRPPDTDSYLLDGDEEQDAVVAQIAAGNSLVVTTLPGTGGTQTIVNALGALVTQNKRVLVASPRPSSLATVTSRLDRLGLSGLAVAVPTLKRDVIRAISRDEKATQPQMADIDAALVRLRKVLLDYRGALSGKHPAFGVSVLDALEELARLDQLPTPPTTRARLDPTSLASLAGERRPVAQLLILAARLGEFRFGPGDSPWYGASFSSAAQGAAAHALAKKLSSTTVPRLLERAARMIGQTRLRPFENIAELGIYVQLFAELRESLDRFNPSVFDRPLPDLVTATAPQSTPEMSRGERHRLQKHAREYVRSGMHVPDLHQSLVRIQQQRVLWQRFAEAGAVPEVPVGLADVQVAYQDVVADLASLDVPLKRTGTAASLSRLPLAQLTYQLAGLAADSEVLANLQERTQLSDRLRELGLDPLLLDLSARHVPEAQVADELELAWWQSVLELQLADNRALLGGSTSVLDRLETDFRLVDEAHAGSGAGRLTWQLAQDWKIGIADHPDEAEGLRQLLRSPRVSPEALAAVAPTLSRSLAPVWLVNPYEVPAIPEDVRFDTVFVLDAGACTLAENVGVLRRAKQIVVFGDPVTQTPSPFTIAVAEVPPAMPRTPTRQNFSFTQGAFVAGGSTATGTDPAAGVVPVGTQLAGTQSGAAASLSSDAVPAKALLTGAPSTGTQAHPSLAPAREVRDLHSDSTFARLKELLPTYELTRSYRAGGDDLVELVGRRFYGGKIESLPWAGTFLGHGSLRVHTVAGGLGLPDPESGAVESVDVEVMKVVELVIEHATQRPKESLMVVTASPKHAIRVQQATLRAASQNAALNNFILSDRSEPFTVLTLDQAAAQARDRVIFSIGYGRTPHGRLLSNFGTLAGLEGPRLLAVALTRPRRSLDIVSCFAAADIDDARMPVGVIALAKVLAEAASIGTMLPDTPDAIEPLLVDLARRLVRLGLTVRLGYRGTLPLAASFGSKAVVVETDQVVTKGSLRETLRLHPEVLRRLGWHYLRVHSFELFSNPEAIAGRVAKLIGAVPAE